MKKTFVLFAFLCIYASSQAQFFGLLGARAGSVNKNSWFNNEKYYGSGWGYAIDGVLAFGIFRYIYKKAGGRPLFFFTDNFEVFKVKQKLNNLEKREALRAYLTENGYRAVRTKRKNEDLFAYTRDGFDDVLQVKFKHGNKIRLRYILTTKHQSNDLYAKETFTSLTAKHKSTYRPLFGQKRRDITQTISNYNKLLAVKKYLLFLSGDDTTNVTRYTNTRMQKKMQLLLNK